MTEQHSQTVATYCRRVVRILWNLITLSPRCREYPDRVLEISWDRSDAITRRLGRALHKRVCRRQGRDTAADYTRFLRNPPQLEVLRNVVLQKNHGSDLRISVLGCSTGAEVHSALFVIRSSRPDLNISATALDISKCNLDKALAAIYPIGSDELESLSEEDINRMFVREGCILKVRNWICEGLSGLAEDAGNPGLCHILEPQDIVFANNFLIHMPDAKAEACFRNIAALVKPSGYLFVWGMDLDVRTRVAKDLNLIPVTYMLEEVYKADRRAHRAWPLEYWGLEPMDVRRQDWETRYATVFQVPSWS